MKRIGRAGLKFPVEVPLSGGFILGVHQQRPDACTVSGLSSSQQSILEQGSAQTSPLMLNIHSQPCQNHDRHWVLGDALDHARRGGWRVNTANSKAVKANHHPTVATDIGLRTVGLLIDKSKAMQKLVECGLATIKGLDGVRAGQFANWLVSA